MIIWINCALYCLHSVRIVPGRQTLDFVPSFKVDDRTWRKPQHLFFSDSDTQDYENIDLAQTTALSEWPITCRRHFVRGSGKRDSQLFTWHSGLMSTDTCTFRLLQNELLNIFYSYHSPFPLSYVNTLLDFLEEGILDSSDGLLVGSIRANSQKWEDPVGFESKRCLPLALANIFKHI